MPDLETLLGNLDSTDYDTVMGAIHALGGSGDPSVIPALSEKARTKLYLEPCVLAVRRFGDDQALKLLESLLDLRDPELCAGYEVVLLDEILFRLFRDIGKSSLDPLARALKHPDHEVRRKAARILDDLGDPAALPALREALASEKDQVNLIVMKNAVEELEGK